MEGTVHTPLGRTGLQVSRLGMGCMRLPRQADAAVDAIRRAVDLGINLFDTAYVYMGGESESILGKALAGGYREKVLVCSKLPIWLVEAPEDFDRLLEEQLRRLATDTIDLYLLHALSRDRLEKNVNPNEVLEQARRARREGKIRFLGLSSHDTPDGVIELLDSELFSVLLVQYNILDRSYAPVMEHAKKLGVGVMVMGPVGGGRLAGPPDAIRKARADRRFFDSALALRFVLSNPNVDVAISGMGTAAQVEANVAVTADEVPLDEGEMERVEAILAEHGRLAECTGCGYCKPCPAEVNIPKNLELLSYWDVYGVPGYVCGEYGFFGQFPSMPGKPASECTGCGECEPKCPQAIPIRERLADLAARVDAETKAERERKGRKE